MKPLVLLVRLIVRDGKTREFQEFERAAAKIMRKHGGRIERVMRPESSTMTGAAIPSEIHWVTFPDQEAFDAYRADPELAALAPKREAAIERTEIVFGRDAESYNES